MTASTLILPPELRAQLDSWITTGYPHETCGTLIGRSEGERTTLVRVTQCRNLNTDRAHDRFELDPGDFQKADTEAREAGLDIVGIWHSHPDHPAEPSETDRVQAWPGWSYIIVTVTAQGTQTLRSWRLDDTTQQFTEENVGAEAS